MFSGKIAFENMNHHQLITAVYILKKRPEFDSTFPKKLREKIELGWSYKPKDRCKLDDFYEVLLEMKIPSLSIQSKNIIKMGQTRPVSMAEQADHAQTQLLAYSPMIEMKWPTQDEKTHNLIKEMITNMCNSSSFAKIFSDTIVNAMLQIPKHRFVDMIAFKSASKEKDNDECLKSVYHHAQALRASQTQNMSSTEITAAQLSLIPLNSGDRVLFLGAKGGYIQTIAAQVVGFQGQVWICSQDNQGLQHVENVLKNHVPTILQQIIKCVLVSKIDDASQVKRALQQHLNSAEQYFNTIHICGAISQESLENFQELLQIEGQLLAPININANNQKFTILHKTRDPNIGQITFNKRILNDWGIIFGPVL